MNKNAQADIGIGPILLVFITVLVGVILLIAVAQTVGSSTNLATYNSSTGGSDATITTPANGASLDLIGQEYISDFRIWNDSSNATIDISSPNSGNWTISEIVSTTTGVKTISLTMDNAVYAETVMNVSYVYGPDGYINDGSTRAIVGLIAIFFALAIAIVALEPTLRSGILQSFGGI